MTDTSDHGPACGCVECGGKPPWPWHERGCPLRTWTRPAHPATPDATEPPECRCEVIERAGFEEADRRRDER